MSTAPGNASAGPGCLACDGPLPQGRRDWCSRSCRAALRRAGSDLAPMASRRDQLERALTHQRALREVGIGLADSYRQRYARRNADGEQGPSAAGGYRDR